MYHSQINSLKLLKLTVEISNHCSILKNIQRVHNRALKLIFLEIENKKPEKNVRHSDKKVGYKG